MDRLLRASRRLALISFLIGGLAQAHALLLSFKIEGQDVVLHYNGRVDAARSRVLLLNADGTHPQKLESGAAEDPASLRVHLGTLAPGSYLLRWEVLSVDGHISRGDQPLQLP